MRSRRFVRGPAGLVLAAAMLSACSGSPESSSHDAHAAEPPTSVETTDAAEPSTSVGTTRPVVVIVPARLRVIEIPSVEIPHDGALAIALHPTQVPVWVSIAPAASAEVCASSLDGDTDPTKSSWGRQFSDCLSFDASGSVMLPAPSGQEHVAFVVRARGEGMRPIVSLSVSYLPADPFLEVIPPLSTRDLAVALTASTSSMGVLAVLIPAFAASPAVTARISQRDVVLEESTRCDFGSEIECVRVPYPGERTLVTLRGEGRTGARTAMLISWATG